MRPRRLRGLRGVRQNAAKRRRHHDLSSLLDNIEKQTGVSPEQFVKLAAAKGFTKPGTEATQITDWLKADYKLGHGHAMAIVKVLKDRANS